MHHVLLIVCIEIKLYLKIVLNCACAVHGWLHVFSVGEQSSHMIKSHDRVTRMTITLHVNTLHTACMVGGFQGDWTILNMNKDCSSYRVP